MNKKQIVSAFLACLATLCLHVTANASTATSQSDFVATISSTIPNDPDIAYHSSKIWFFITLTRKDGTPVTFDQLREVHTRKLHLLVIDESLTDYHHIHPEAADAHLPGKYTFKFDPKTQKPYRFFADITPVDGKQTYVMAELAGTPCPVPCINETLNNEATQDGLHYRLSLDKPLKKGQASMATLMITRENGMPVKELEPVMGAFAHLVGFYADGKSVAHIHPMGKEPTTESDRGGPSLMFHLMPDKEGYMAFFAQVMVDGKMRFVRFGQQVTAP